MKLHLKNINIEHYTFANKIQEVLGSLNGVTIIKDTFIVEVNEEKHEALKQLKQYFASNGKTMIISCASKQN